MALFEANFFSVSLARPVDILILNPSDTPLMFTKGNPHYERPCKILYLLHGYNGNYRDWLIGSPIRDLSAKYNLCIVLASGENSFYVDQKGTGRKYDRFFSSDLPDFIQTMFHLSSKPEDNLIGGFSMGGSGALTIGLHHPDRFGGIIALSSALIQPQLHKMKPTDKNPMADYDYYVSTFGDLSKVLGSEKDPEALALKAKESGTLPRLFLSCGSEDFLIAPNRAFEAFLTKNEIEHHYEEHPGEHNWTFWNSVIEPGVRYLLGE